MFWENWFNGLFDHVPIQHSVRCENGNIGDLFSLLGSIKSMWNGKSVYTRIENKQFRLIWNLTRNHYSAGQNWDGYQIENNFNLLMKMVGPRFLFWSCFLFDERRYLSTKAVCFPISVSTHTINSVAIHCDGNAGFHSNVYFHSQITVSEEDAGMDRSVSSYKPHDHFPSLAFCERNNGDVEV